MGLSTDFTRETVDPVSNYDHYDWPVDILILTQQDTQLSYI